jgi:hypothetical protein
MVGERSRRLASAGPGRRLAIADAGLVIFERVDPEQAEFLRADVERVGVTHRRIASDRRSRRLRVRHAEIEPEPEDRRDDEEGLEMVAPPRRATPLPVSLPRRQSSTRLR